MTGPPRYFDLIREMKNPFNFRLSLVGYARQHGIKAAAQMFQRKKHGSHGWED